MNRTEHYLEAESLLSQAERLRRTNPDKAMRLVHTARVHAVLANVSDEVAAGVPRAKRAKVL